MCVVDEMCGVPRRSERKENAPTSENIEDVKRAGSEQPWSSLASFAMEREQNGCCRLEQNLAAVLSIFVTKREKELSRVALFHVLCHTVCRAVVDILKTLLTTQDEDSLRYFQIVLYTFRSCFLQ